MRRTPLKRTAWPRAPSTTAEKLPNRAHRLAARAESAINSARITQAATSTRKQAPALASQAQIATQKIANAGTTPSTVLRATVARPKTQAQRNSHLRAMARGKPCLLQVLGVCCRDSATVVCCHSNLSIHGKAGARKADDQYSVWGCMTCHSWLDQGPAPRGCKEAAFMHAHLRQVLAWRAIATDPAAAPRDRAAAQWALELLDATPNPAQTLAQQA